MENGNGEYVNEKTTRSKSRKQPKDNKGFSTQRENPEPGGGLQMPGSLNTCFPLLKIITMNETMTMKNSAVHSLIVN